MKKFLLLGLIIIISGCTKEYKDIYKKLSQNYISASELESELEHPTQKLVVIDIRNENDYYNGHIPGAINIPYTTISDITNKVLRIYPIIIYDNDEIYAKSVIKRLKYYGYDVKILYGGLRLWNGRLER